jgi:hypothetical protein
MALTCAHSLQTEKSIVPGVLEFPKTIPGVFAPDAVMLNSGHAIASVDGLPVSAIAVHRLIISSLRARSASVLLHV